MEEKSVENIKMPSHEIFVSRAKPEDARGMQEVFYKTWLNTYPNVENGISVDDIEDRYKNAFTDETINKRAERILHPPEGETVFVAKEDEKVVGLCFVEKYPEKNQIQAIYVLPEYQGKGIGKKLWSEAKKVFDAGKDVIIEVATYNTQAIEFYKKLGFVDTGKRWRDEKFKMKSGTTIPEMEMVIRAEQIN